MAPVLFLCQRPNVARRENLGTSRKFGVDGQEPAIRPAGRLALAGFIASLVIPSLAVLLVLFPLENLLVAQVLDPPQEPRIGLSTASWQLAVTALNRSRRRGE